MSFNSLKWMIVDLGFPFTVFRLFFIGQYETKAQVVQKIFCHFNQRCPSLVIQCLPDTGSEYMDGEAVRKYHLPPKSIHGSRLRGLKLFIIPSQKWMDGSGFFDIVVGLALGLLNPNILPRTSNTTYHKKTWLRYSPCWFRNGQGLK